MEHIANNVYNQFLKLSTEELGIIFSYFKSQGIDELVLDLRYNSGGLLSTSLYLAELISGVDNTGEVFQKLAHNGSYSDWDTTYYFSEQEQPLNLDRVFVIATGSTCSASEALINGLKPYMDVIVVGDTTCGKPVGMTGYDFGDKHISPIEFEIVNSDNEGGYFEIGIRLQRETD